MNTLCFFLQMVGVSGFLGKTWSSSPFISSILSPSESLSVKRSSYLKKVEVKQIFGCIESKLMAYHDFNDNGDVYYKHNKYKPMPKQHLPKITDMTTAEIRAELQERGIFFSDDIDFYNLCRELSDARNNFINDASLEPNDEKFYSNSKTKTFEERPTYFNTTFETFGYFDLDQDLYEIEKVEEIQEPQMFKYESTKSTNDFFDRLDHVMVQGSALKTCSLDENVDRVVVCMRNGGRCLNADIELWQGPDLSPQKMKVSMENGNQYPFRAIVETPGGSNSIAIRNTGIIENCLTAAVEIEGDDSETPYLDTDYRIVQGSAVYATPFAPTVQSVRVSLKSQRRPLNARVEILQGPNNRQVLEIFTDNGKERPFNVIIDTPGAENVVRIVNTNTVDYPFSALIEPYIVDNDIIDASHVDCIRD